MEYVQFMNILAYLLHYIGTIRGRKLDIKVKSFENLEGNFRID